jgi:hypothetical protein
MEKGQPKDVSALPSSCPKKIRQRITKRDKRNNFCKYAAERQQVEEDMKTRKHR